MITGSTPCFLSGSQEQNMYGHWSQEQENFVLSSSLQQSTSQQNDHDNHSTSLLYNLSLLFDKFNQVQSHLKPFIIPGQRQTLESTPIALANMGTLIQEIITTASSMLFTCQQMSLGVTLGENINSQVQGPSQQNWYDDEYITCETSNNVQVEKIETEFSQDNYDIVELDAANLIAKYTHYCQVCGKGFKRDANLRMHMRAHGDEYKSSAALVNPMKNDMGDGLLKLARKYSCPQEGCRWNRKHAKFQPLKSIICVKNHYKRSHCPKMYLCKKCNAKRFSVLSDLRTHEKHCGDLRWQCSCGTTFSRKDKLLGHVALFVGHTPSVHSLRNI